MLRNPHIARNEEIQLSFFDNKDNMRYYHFHQLIDVVMVNSNMLAAERLGGADFDGDMIKTIADPIINACVRRNYDIARFEKYKSLENRENIPLLMIPAAEPRIADAEDWRARMETVKGTFSSRIGQICKSKKGLTRPGVTSCVNFRFLCTPPAQKDNGSSVLTRPWPTDWSLVLCG